MDHHSSYSAPRSDRTSPSYRSQGSRRNTYTKRTIRDNPFLSALLFYILPFVIINLILFIAITYSPKVTLTIADTIDFQTVDISFEINSLIPIKSVELTLDDLPLEYTKEKGTYSYTVTSNGYIIVKANAINGMTGRASEHIAVLDDAPPTIDTDNVIMEDGLLQIIAEDSQSGINFSAVYATNEAGETIKPIQYDKETGLIVFELESGSLEVYIVDYAGNPNQATFSLVTTGIDTENRDMDFSDDE